MTQITKHYKFGSLPHSGGNKSVGDLLSVNSVPRINPVPRICTYTFNFKHILYEQLMYNRHWNQLQTKTILKGLSRPLQQSPGSC